MKKLLNVSMIVVVALLLFTTDASVQEAGDYPNYVPIVMNGDPLVVERAGLVDTGMGDIPGKLYADGRVIFATFHEVIEDSTSSHSEEPASPGPAAPDNIGGIQIYTTLQPYGYNMGLTKLYEDVGTSSGWHGYQGIAIKEDHIKVLTGEGPYSAYTEILDRSTLSAIDTYYGWSMTDPVLTEITHGDYKYSVSGNIYDISEGWSRYIGDLDLEGSASCIVRVGDYLYLLTEVGIEIFPLL